MLIAYVPSPECYRACPAGGGGSDLTTYLIVVGSVAAAVLLAYMVKLQLDFRLRTRGLEGTAVITALEGRRVVPGTADMKVDVTLRVTGADGAAFETWTTAELPILGMPQPGWRVAVRYSPRDHHRIVLTGGPTPPEEESGDRESPASESPAPSTEPPASASHPMER